MEARAVRARMDTSAVQVVLTMGYSRDLLLKVIEHRLVTVGKCKGMFLYSTVSSPFDHSKHFKLHPLADLCIPTPTRLLLEAF